MNNKTMRRIENITSAIVGHEPTRAEIMRMTDEELEAIIDAPYPGGRAGPDVRKMTDAQLLNIVQDGKIERQA